MLLDVKDLHAWYGKSQVLHGVDLALGQGEIVALLGRNGSGRSTMAKAIMGMVACAGSVQWRGQPILGRPPFEIARLGIGYVPESRDIFPHLTVEQNLQLGRKGGGKGSRWTAGDMVRMFPSLQQRRHAAAAVLSGGEQQMLTLCRTLMGDPDLVIIDEPTEGLAPIIVERVGHCLMQLRQRNVSVLLIEQKLTIAMAISDRVLVMGQGRIVFDGTPTSLRENAVMRQQWLQV